MSECHGKQFLEFLIDNNYSVNYDGNKYFGIEFWCGESIKKQYGIEIEALKEKTIPIWRDNESGISSNGSNIGGFIKIEDSSTYSTAVSDLAKNFSDSSQKQNNEIKTNLISLLEVTNEYKEERKNKLLGNERECRKKCEQLQEKKKRLAELRKKIKNIEAVLNSLLKAKPPKKSKYQIAKHGHQLIDLRNLNGKNFRGLYEDASIGNEDAARLATAIMDEQRSKNKCGAIEIIHNEKRFYVFRYIGRITS